MDTPNHFIAIRIVGVLHIIFAVIIVLLLAVGPDFFRYILPILLALMIFYAITGYRLLTLTIRGRIWIVIPAALIMLFIASQIPHSVELYGAFREGTVFADGYIVSGQTIMLDLLINGSLLLSNLFIVYVLYVSKAKSYFQKHLVND